MSRETTQPNRGPDRASLRLYRGGRAPKEGGGSRSLVRGSVRHRLRTMLLVSGAVTLAVLVAFAAYTLLIGRQLHVVLGLTSVSDRVAEASEQLASSRAGLLSYTGGVAPTLDEAVASLDRASKLLAESRANAGQELGAQIDTLQQALVDHRAQLVAIVEASPLNNPVPEGEGVLAASPLVDEAVASSLDLNNRIGRVAEDVRQASDAALAMLRQRVYLLAMVILSLAFVGLVGVSLVFANTTGSIARGVEALHAGAQQVARGRQGFTIPVEGDGELGAVAVMLNRMASRLAVLGSPASTPAPSVESGLLPSVTRDAQARSIVMQGVIRVGRVIAGPLDLSTVQHRAAAEIRDAFSLDWAGIYLVAENGGAIELRASAGDAGGSADLQEGRLAIGQGLVGGSIAEDKLRGSALEIAAGTSAEEPEPVSRPERITRVAIPLRAGERVIGALSLVLDQGGSHSTLTVGSPSLPATLDALVAEAPDLLQVMADLVAGAIESARRYGASLSALAPARETYRNLTREGWRRVFGDQAAGYQLTGAGAVSRSEGPWQPELEPARVSGEVVREGRTVTLPLSVRGEVIGAVRLRKEAPKTPPGGSIWTDHEVELARTIVARLGVALDSARLYQDAQLSLARERAAREVADHMRNTLDWDELMQTAVREIGRTVQASRFSCSGCRPRRSLSTPPFLRRPPRRIRSLSTHTASEPRTASEPQPPGSEREV